MKIIYDGECPFCSKYVRLIQLKKTIGYVELINARVDTTIKEKLKEQEKNLLSNYHYLLENLQTLMLKYMLPFAGAYILGGSLSYKTESYF